MATGTSLRSRPDLSTFHQSKPASAVLKRGTSSADGEHVVGHRPTAAGPGADRDDVVEPRVLLGAGLEPRRGDQVGGIGVADAHVLHEDVGAVVGLQQQAHVEAELAVRAHRHPVTTRAVHRALQARPLEGAATAGVDDHPGSHRPGGDHAGHRGRGSHGEQVLELGCGGHVRQRN